MSRDKLDYSMRREKVKMYINNDIDYISYLKGKGVYIFGAGFVGKKTAFRLGKCDIQPIGFIDNNKQLDGEKVDDIEIFSFDRYVSRRDDEMIIICSQYEKEIKLQLMNHNIYKFVSVNQIDFGGEDEYYDEIYFEWQQRIGEFGGRIKAKMFEQHVNKDSVVVEFGSGGGYLLKKLEAKEKIGIEINETARKNAETLGIKSVRTIDEIEDEYADVIISTSVLEHVEDPLGALRELYKKLKHGGKIVFHVPNESCETEYSRSEINNHIYTWNCLNLGNLFKKAGYFVHKVERVQEVWPNHYMEIEKQVSKEMFEEICLLGGKAFDENRCIIIAFKN